MRINYSNPIKNVINKSLEDIEFSLQDRKNKLIHLMLLKMKDEIKGNELHCRERDIVLIPI
jgi:hypothetical protein